MAELSTLSNSYSQNLMTLDEYRDKRSHLLMLIDEELNGVKIIETEQQDEVNAATSIVDKALSFITNR